MTLAAIYRWITSNQLIFDWIYGTAAVCLVMFVFVEVLRGRLLSPVSPTARVRPRSTEEARTLPASAPAGRLGLAELKLKDAPAHVFHRMAETK